MKRIWQLLFWLAATGEITSIIFDVSMLHLASKPLLLAALFGYFYVASNGFSPWRILVLVSLVFSWAGDVFLMFDGFFIAGLIAFLVAHMLYILVYLKTGANFEFTRKWPLTLLVAYGIALLSFLFGYLGDLLIPVLVYALVLLGMGIFAFQRKGQTSSKSYLYLTIGAVLFVASDSILAINQFAVQVPFASFFIMTTYIGAQFLIVRGLLYHGTQMN